MCAAVPAAGEPGARVRRLPGRGGPDQGVGLQQGRAGRLLQPPAAGQSGQGRGGLDQCCRVTKRGTGEQTARGGEGGTAPAVGYR